MSSSLVQEVNRLMNRGDELEQTRLSNNCEKAIEEYQCAIELASQHDLDEYLAQLFSKQAHCYMRLMRFADAELFARRSVEADHSFVKGYYILANALKQQRMIPSASRFIEKALEIEPNSVKLQKMKEDLLAAVHEQPSQPDIGGHQESQKPASESVPRVQSNQQPQEPDGNNRTIQRTRADIEEARRTLPPPRQIYVNHPFWHPHGPTRRLSRWSSFISCFLFVALTATLTLTLTLRLNET